MKESLTIREGELGFVSRMSGGLRTRNPIHRHDELELNLAISGEAEYLVDGELLRFLPGQALWLFPEQEHALASASPSFSMWVIVFRRRLLRETCNEEERKPLLGMKAPLESFRQLGHDVFKKLGQVCEEAAESAEVDSEMFNATLRYLMVRAWKGTLESEVEALDPMRLHGSVFRAAMRLHETPQIESLGELSKEVGLSQEHLSRMFRRQMGLSLSAYRNVQRMRRFIELRQEGERYNLLEAALEAGFGSYAQCFRVCKALKGVAPSELS
ncbi:MAG: helix-turn-helix domain-containing protein [Verrucomicrobiota bacterium]